MPGKYPGIIVLIAVLACGCEVYHKKPLTPESVQKALAPPSAEELRVKAANIKHPLLKPVAFDETKGLSPDEAAVLAVLTNPGLRALRDQRGIAQAELLQAQLLPNPVLSAGLEFPTGGTTQGTVDAYGLGLDWDLSELISYSARNQSAKSSAAEIDLYIAWQEWQVAEGAKASVYRLIALRREKELAAESDRLLSENLEVVRKAVDRGLLTRLDLAAAASARDQVHAVFLDLQKQSEQERLDLNYLLGQPPEKQIKLRPETELPSSFTPPAQEILSSDLESRRLDLLALHRGYDAQEASLRAAILDQFPKISVGLIHARDTGNVVTTGFGVSIALPIFDRNQGQVALQKATRQELFDEYTDRVATAYSDIGKLRAGIESLNGQIRAGEESVPNLEKLVDAYRTQSATGDVDVLSYYAAWNELNQKQIEILSLKQELAEARIALELETGIYQIESAAPSTGSAPQEKAQE